LVRQRLNRLARLLKRQSLAVYDTFPFCNEFEILELRLHELDPVVDFFVLVEANKTQSGIPKPLYFKQNAHRFADFAHKIIHVIVEDWPQKESAWIRERYQRDQIRRGLTTCRDDDWILMSDVDEIPRASAVREAIRRAEAAPVLPRWERRALLNPAVIYMLRKKLKRSHPAVWVFHQRPSSYFLNFVRDTPGPATRMVRYADLGKPSQLRRWVGRAIENGGWHFTCLGDVAAIQEKIRGMAHQEYNRPEFLDPARIARDREEGEYIFAASGGGGKFRVVPVDESFPQYLREHQERFAHLLKPVETPVTNES
jgi:beta-1,4-mannosyl-glycoprotein beta-1,4-N-acetylglucosaminyltransferase